MKKLLLSTAAFALLASASIAWAQDQGADHRDDGNRGSSPPAAAAPPHAPAGTTSTRGAGGMRGPQGARRGSAAPPPASTTSRGPNDGANNRASNNNGSNRGNAQNTPNNRSGANNNNNRSGFNRNASRPNYSQYHRDFNAPRRYQGGNYSRPPGYYSHRWSFGEYLPFAFFGQNYWINDYYDFGLMSPPPGTVWVRYGNDVLLVDEYTGEVIQVEYNVFY